MTRRAREGRYAPLVDGSWWQMRQSAAVRAWEAMGWWAHLDNWARTVTFWRIAVIDA